MELMIRPSLYAHFELHISLIVFFVSVPFPLNMHAQPFQSVTSMTVYGNLREFINLVIVSCNPSSATQIQKGVLAAGTHPGYSVTKLTDIEWSLGFFRSLFPFVTSDTFEHRLFTPSLLVSRIVCFLPSIFVGLNCHLWSGWFFFLPSLYSFVFGGSYI